MKKLLALLLFIVACNSSPVGPTMSSAVTPPEETAPAPQPVCVEWGWGVRQTPVGPMEIIVCKQWDYGV